MKSEDKTPDTQNPKPHTKHGTNDKTDDGNTQYGHRCCKSRTFNPCTNLLSFTITVSILGFFMQSFNAILSSQISSIEKQFNLSSTVSGTVMSSSHIGFLISVLLVSHFGKTKNLPKIIGVCSIIYAVAGLIVPFTNIIQPPNLPKEPSSLNDSDRYEAKFLCQESNVSLNDVTGTDTSGTSSSGLAVWILIIAYTITGAASGARMPLAVAYIDRNTKGTGTGAFHIGVMMTTLIFGPSVSMLVAGAFAKIPADLKETYISPTDPRWIGAWWLGFVLFGTLILIPSFTLMCFPKRMPGIRRDKETKAEEPSSFIQKAKDMPLSVLRILRRPVYTLALLNSCAYDFAFAGLMSFGTKYIEYQFNIPLWKATMILGTSHMISSSTGTFTGGMLTSRLKLTRVGCLKLIFAVHVTTTLLNSTYLVFGCSNQPVEGIDFAKRANFTYQDCNCNDKNVLLVCGSDNITYFSPCQAGCWNQTDDVYGGCSRVEGMTATPGICEDGCPFLIPYMVANILVSLIGTLAIVPSFMIRIRSVEDRDKPLALAIGNFVSVLIAFLPSPITYGKVIDTACKVHKTVHGEDVSCSLYDIVNLRYKVFGLEVSLKLVSLVLMVTALIVCIREDRGKEVAKMKKSDMKL